MAIAAPADNGTATHTVSPSSGTVGTGTLFTPTAGNLLVCLAEGSVTSTTPSGWTLPSGGSAINNTGLYVWYRTAAGGDSFTTTHNGSDYPVVFDFYEFPSGSTFGASTSAIAVVAQPGGAGPTLSGLTGTNLLCAAAGQGTTGNSGTFTWSSGVEATDFGVNVGTTEGYNYSLAYLEDSVLTSWSSAATSNNSGITLERLVFSVVVAAGGAPPYPWQNLTVRPRYR